MALPPFWARMGLVSQGQDRAAPGLRCTHCGRAVRETMHTRETWLVDYYVLVGGAVEAVSVAGEDGEKPTTYLRLVDAERWVTCRDCYVRSEIRALRERMASGKGGLRP
ncbi:MAG: hypothetical protein KatS3mg076_1669 [Candidatus Binatia bacterium]|nr:MAG: hypothetical protein KatS3mg076_1669 [Candidatus Binatia bacterium]